MFSGLGIRLAVVGVAIAAFAGMGLYIRALRAERGELEQAYLITAEAAGAANAELERVVEDSRRLDRILAGRERARVALVRRNERLTNEIRTLKRTSPAVRDWANTRVPGELVGLLNASNSDENPNDQGPAAGGSDGAHASPADPDRD